MFLSESRSALPMKNLSPPKSITAKFFQVWKRNTPVSLTLQRPRTEQNERGQWFAVARFERWAGHATADDEGTAILQAVRSLLLSMKKSGSLKNRAHHCEHRREWIILSKAAAAAARRSHGISS